VASDQKKAECAGRTLVGIDEAGFYLLPALVCTWAPVGEPPVVRAPGRYDHVSAISAITPSGQLLLHVQAEAYHGVDVVRFLKHVLRHIEGKLLIMWDGASIHRSLAIKAFLAAGGAQRIHLERLPGYAPDLNPDEGIWSYLKDRELKNLVCANKRELRDELRRAVARLRHKRHVIQGCITQAGRSVSLFMQRAIFQLYTIHLEHEIAISLMQRYDRRIATRGIVG